MKNEEAEFKKTIGRASSPSQKNEELKKQIERTEALIELHDKVQEISKQTRKTRATKKAPKL